SPNSGIIHSSGVNRSARCCAASSFARVVFPAPGSPTIRNSMGSARCGAMTWVGPAGLTYKCCPPQGKSCGHSAAVPRIIRLAGHALVSAFWGCQVTYANGIQGRTGCPWCPPDDAGPAVTIRDDLFGYVIGGLIGEGRGENEDDLVLR